LPWLALNSVVCSAASASLFFIAALANVALEGAHDQVPQSLWVGVVALVGAMLGFLVGALAKRAPNPSIERTDSSCA
jgi:uncharacterized membrane protein YfcA